MKAFTFLGAAKAYETAYVMSDGREHVAKFFGVAMARFFPDLEMRVLVTKEAEETHLAEFTGQVEDYVGDLQSVPIPPGRDEAEMWQIFEAVIEAVNEEEEVIFDITHGFRSLPFLSFLAAAYLRVVKKVRLKAVLYGNYEARNTTVTPNRAPVIDLTPFVSLLDWMVAADRFTRFGDAQDLADLLRHARPAQRWPDAPTKQEKIAGQRLSQAAKSLDTVSAALRLIRPIEVLAAAAALPQALNNAVQQTDPYAQPFMPLKDQVIRAYAPLALDKAEHAHIYQQLAHERQLVHWYLERKQYAQAVATAREWLITWTLAHSGGADQLDKAARQAAEDIMGYDIQSKRKNPKAIKPDNYKEFSRLPDYQAVLTLFEQLGHVRNDMMHAGKRKGALSAASLTQKIPELCGRIDTLPLPSAAPTANS